MQHLLPMLAVLDAIPGLLGVTAARGFTFRRQTEEIDTFGEKWR